MLFWEKLNAIPTIQSPSGVEPGNLAGGNQRLPFDQRCAARTKDGGRCHGKVRANCDYCVFHDPAVIAKRKQSLKDPEKRRRRSLARMPDGYLRKLTSRHAVGQAMDRLYREIRLELITPEMGYVMFRILTRLMDDGLCHDDTGLQNAWNRTKAARMRPKLSDLMTRAERRAWRKAVERAPSKFIHAKKKAATHNQTNAEAPVPQHKAPLSVAS